MSAANPSMSRSISLFRAKASKYAIFGVLISSGALILSTLLSSYFHYGELSLAGIGHVQKNNMLLWVLDGMPFLFAIWGQYVSSAMTHEAGTMVMNQTSELRFRTALLESQAMHDSTHDPLTGLPNRVLLRERLDLTLQDVHSKGHELAVMLLDMDGFKEINDTLGHENGDRILKKVAELLGREVEKEETLARMGGDEFALLLPEVNKERDVRHKAMRIQEALSKPLVFEGLELYIRMSIGAAVFPEHGLDSDNLIMRAEMAMYVAKEKQNGFTEYSPAFDRYSPGRLALMGELRHAIGAGELVLYYQPKINSLTGKITAAEGLIRWHHPRRGLLPPNEFVPVAEQIGLVKEMTRWVLGEAVRQLSAWRKDGTDICVSVNLSAKDLLDPELPKMLAALLHTHDVRASQLILEITETSIIADPDRALGILFRLAEMGIGISIDDFGTGYSSLSYLKRMPAGEIKIDRSFVMDMLENGNDAIIVQTAIALAHSLGLKVVAEGVENQETADRLKALSCDFLQGFLYSKPVPSAEFIDLADKNKVQ